mgnify:CR=1 FL=1
MPLLPFSRAGASWRYASDPVNMVNTVNFVKMLIIFCKFIFEDQYHILLYKAMRNKKNLAEAVHIITLRRYIGL